jgi:hypothetical protein
MDILDDDSLLSVFKNLHVSSIRNVLESHKDKQYNAKLLKTKFKNNEQKIDDLINDIYDKNTSVLRYI